MTTDLHGALPQGPEHCIAEQNDWDVEAVVHPVFLVDKIATKVRWAPIPLHSHLLNSFLIVFIIWIICHLIIDPFELLFMWSDDELFILINNTLQYALLIEVYVATEAQR